MNVPGGPFGSGDGGGTANFRCRHCGRDVDMALQDMEGVILNNGVVSSSRHKRFRMDEDQENEYSQVQQMLSSRGRNFVPIRATPTTFHTEDVKQKSETIYIPLPDDILVNVRTAEQISYEAGTYFIGDHRGSYLQNSQGHVINLWRYSETARKLYVSRSFLFTNVMDFVHVKEILENI